MPINKPTQEFVPIKEIRDGVVFLKDGSMRAILMTSTLNFALKSEDEQTAIILQYQNFLNSLDFTVQFFIESRKMNISPYINLLENAEKEQTNELLKIQTIEYMEFIKNFVKTTNIVSKNFYIVVPYSSKVLSGNIFGRKKTESEKKDTQFEEAKTQLQQRAVLVQGGLSSLGIRAVLLNTEELIELFYKLFNPGELEKETAKQAAQQYSR
jgi:hypothetical protein